MAEEVEMKPVDAAEPPKANPLAAPSEKKVATIKLTPQPRSAPGVGVTGALRPGLKLPPKPGFAAGLKLPSKPGMAAGLKLPPKPGVTAALKPGLKLPASAGLKSALKLPPKPVIRKPGETVATPVPKPVAVDAQGVGKLPTVAVAAVERNDVQPIVSAAPKPLEALKSVTQKLKGITQEIPQQAILRKTGIIADSAMTEAQKEAAKHKTSRISLSDAMGVAPVKNENAPMKTIRIKRPINLAGAAKVPAPDAAPAVDTAAKPEAASAVPSPASITQRKTLKISRPGGAMRPSGKFGVRRPGATAPVAPAVEAEKPAAEAAVADIPELPMEPVARPVANEGPVWLWTLSTLVQVAACVVIAGLAWLLYQNTQTLYF